MNALLIATIAVQWLHILAGIFWVGGQLFGALVVWPVLLAGPADRARETLGSFGRIGGPVMSVAAQLTLWLGVARGTLMGPVRSTDVLLGSAYGLTFVAALLLTVAAMIYGGRTRGALMARMWHPDGTWQTGGARWIRRRNYTSLGLLGGVIACMVLMRFGL